MKKSLLALTLATAFCSMQAENKIFISNIEAEPGTINLELKLNAEANSIAGYQAKLTTTSSEVTVVEGDAYMADDANKIPGDNSFFGTHNVGGDGPMALNILSYSGTCQTFGEKSDAVIATIPVTINEPGTYDFTLSGIILANSEGVTAKQEEEVNFTVKVYPKGDFNGDFIVNSTDLSNFLGSMRTKVYSASCDFNHDGIINSTDLTYMLNFMKSNK